MGVKASKIELPTVGGGSAKLAKSAHDPMQRTERENLGAWHRYGIDVCDVYEITEVIAQGHMGEVTKVCRKKEERGMHNSATRARSTSDTDLCLSGGGRIPARRSAPMGRSPLNGMKKRISEHSEMKRNGTIDCGPRPRSPFRKKKIQQRVALSNSRSSSSQDSLHLCSQPPGDLATNGHAPPPSPRSILKQASWGKKESCESADTLHSSLFAPDLGGAEIQHTRSLSDEPANFDKFFPPPSPPPPEGSSQDQSDDSDSEFDDNSFVHMWKERLQGAKEQREQALQALDSEVHNSLRPRRLCNSERSYLELSHSSHRSVRFKRQYACKTVLVSRIKRGHLEQLLNEINILRALDHPYILQLYEVYQTKRESSSCSEELNHCGKFAHRYTMLTLITSLRCLLLFCVFQCRQNISHYRALHRR